MDVGDESLVLSWATVLFMVTATKIQRWGPTPPQKRQIASYTPLVQGFMDREGDQGRRQAEDIILVHFDVENIGDFMGVRRNIEIST